uniref:Receptor ligand binding region domain-containing protein n=1 Tax=Varanus komodoensis TaxID=61221 RepID=A0A8D2L4K9_VARKO
MLLVRGKLLIYGSFDPVLSDKTHFPMFFQMVPNESSQYDGIVQLLKYFGWNWIGLLVPEGDSGETFLQTLKPMLFHNDICIGLTQVIPKMKSYSLNVKSLSINLNKLSHNLSHCKINVTLVSGDGQSMECFRILLEASEWFLKHPMEKVWVTISQWDVTAMFPWSRFPEKSLNGTLSFSLHTKVVPGFQVFLEDINPFQSSFYLIHRFWSNAFLCSLPLYNKHIPGGKDCTGEERLRDLSGFLFEMEMSGHSYNIYNAVYALAHACHDLYLTRAKQRAIWHHGKQNLRDTFYVLNLNWKRLILWMYLQIQK